MAMNDLLQRPLTAWFSGGGAEGDIVLASRIRLARNLNGIPFPNRASEAELAAVWQALRASVEDLMRGGCEYAAMDLTSLSALERYILVEKHIISPRLAREPQQRGLIVDAEAGVSIMVNEEDHIRIQCLQAGLDLATGLQAANAVDDVLEARHDLAFLPEYGYLTACPTNVGTGLRASVMLHLPALVMTKQIERVMQAATQLGLAVRGLYGEGSDAAGNVFQISNQLTLGLSEAEMVGNLDGVVRQVVEHERGARRLMQERAELELQDRVWRAFGVLRYARTLGGVECLSMLSQVRLGIDLGILAGLPAVLFNELMVATRPAFLQKIGGTQKLGPEERRRLRAELVRDIFKREV